MPGAPIPLWSIPILYAFHTFDRTKRVVEDAFTSHKHEPTLPGYNEQRRMSKLGFLQTNLGKIQKTIHPDNLKIALANDPYNSQLHLEYGLDLLKLGRTDEAIQQFKTVLKIDGFAYSAWGYLGFALIATNNYTDGHQAFSNLINVQKNETHKSMVQTIQQNTHKLILTDFHKPTLCSVCHHLLLGLTKQGYQCSRCKQAFHVECSRHEKYTCNPSSSPHKKYESGHQLKSTIILSLTWCKTCGKNVGNRHRPKICTLCKNTFHPDCVSATDFCLAAPCEVSLPLALSGRGTCHYQLQKYQEAIQDFTEAINLSVDEPESDTQINNASLATFFANRALCHMILKDYTSAVSDFSTAIGLGLNDSQIFTARSTAYQLLGLHEEAEKDRMRALVINPHEIVNIFPYELPKDLVYEVFSHLNLEELKKAALTCKQWKELIYAKFLSSYCFYPDSTNNNNNNLVNKLVDFM